MRFNPRVPEFSFDHFRTPYAPVIPQAGTLTVHRVQVNNSSLGGVIYGADVDYFHLQDVVVENTDVAGDVLFRMENVERVEVRNVRVSNSEAHIHVLLAAIYQVTTLDVTDVAVHGS